MLIFAAKRIRRQKIAFAPKMGFVRECVTALVNRADDARYNIKRSHVRTSEARKECRMR